MADQNDLAELLGDLALFDGHPVKSIGIEMPALSGGLRDALDVEPFIIHGDQRAFLVVEVIGNKFKHEPFIDRNANEKKSERKGGPWQLVMVLDPGTVALVDEDLVSEVIETMAKRVRALRDAEAGQSQIPGVDDGTRPENMSDEEWEASLAKAEATAAEVEKALADATPLVDDSDDFLAGDD